MKKIFFLFAFAISALLPSISSAATDIYKFDPNHTSITWIVNHFGFSSVSGKLTSVDGNLNLDEFNPQNSSVQVSVKTPWIFTGLPTLDDHLKGKDFLNVSTFSFAKFVSDSISMTGQSEAKIYGKLTLLGVTKPIILDAKINKIAINPITQIKTVGISAVATIKRSQFGMTFGIPQISDNVKLLIEAEGVLLKPASEGDGSSPQYPAKEWKLSPQKSKVEFTAFQNSSTVTGSFKRFTGNINFDPTNLTKSSVKIEVDTTSIDTSFPEASQIAQNAAWLATSAFPKATFASDRFIAIGSKEFQVEGQLTIKGKTLATKFYFILDSYSNDSLSATGSFTIKRSDFGISDKDPKKASDVQNGVDIKFTISADR